jgi:mycofactocin system transcriptional regulator
METTRRARTAGGRPPATSSRELERIALALFARDGFDATTVDDIAAAAGIGRRTFFRYYESKNDVVWGDFESGLAAFEDWLAQSPPGTPLGTALADAVVRFNALEAPAVAAHRQRMELILRVPALQAHSTLRYAEWRGVVARFAAARLGLPEQSLQPQLVAHAALAAAVAAYEQWLQDDAADLADLLRTSFGALGTGLDSLGPAVS